ncbi:aKG-HExxH-type peptide beta-hydroxylase [Photorhabdus caribbeanensis]|uniref:aKG-HExxH-type peptide beta-hydroxylase n=1 Tax=Photorhabdus caribbeanensis TaxID=1004165 RepID=UPI001BD5C288|nr:HEXXH motif-containing putative peptide modification protein [Photorhabdus caribbeanensis]MBS9425035.1 hypothetical protein [Photorhabdus caribbeanensis]
MTVTKRELFSIIINKNVIDFQVNLWNKYQQYSLNSINCDTALLDNKGEEWKKKVKLYSLENKNKYDYTIKLINKNMVEQNDNLSKFEYCDDEEIYKKTLVAINNICMSNENLSYAMNLYINDILIVKCDNFIASSSIKFLGTIIIAPKKHWEVIDYMENLIHEMSHIDLYIKQLVDPLVISKNLIKSPFRNYDRPAIGVYHSAFVLSRIILYTRHKNINESNPKIDCCRIESHKKKLIETLHLFNDSINLTDMGSFLLHQMKFVTLEGFEVFHE